MCIYVFEPQPMSSRKLSAMSLQVFNQESQARLLSSLEPSRDQFRVCFAEPQALMVQGKPVSVKVHFRCRMQTLQLTPVISSMCVLFHQTRSVRKSTFGLLRMGYPP